MGYEAAFLRRYVRPVSVDLYLMVISDEEECYSLRVFGQVGSTGRVLESLYSGPNA
jgi:hypothetical protein